MKVSFLTVSLKVTHGVTVPVLKLHFETLSAYSGQNINGLKAPGYDDF